MPATAQTKPGLRATRVLWRLAAGLLLMSAFTALASGFWHYELRRWSGDGFSCLYLEVARGRVELGRTSITRVMDTGPQQTLEYQSGISWRRRWSSWGDRPHFARQPFGDVPDVNVEWVATLPLWVPMAGSALAVAPPIVVRALNRRRATAGRCPTCGYSLAGLTGAVCPECGRAVILTGRCASSTSPHA